MLFAVLRTVLFMGLYRRRRNTAPGKKQAPDCCGPLIYSLLILFLMSAFIVHPLVGGAVLVLVLLLATFIAYWQVKAKAAGKVKP